MLQTIKYILRIVTILAIGGLLIVVIVECKDHIKDFFTISKEELIEHIKLILEIVIQTLGASILATLVIGLVFWIWS